MKIKYIIIAILIVISGILITRYFSESEEKKVKKQFHLLSEWVSKDPDEAIFTMSHKIKHIATLFAEDCGLKADIISLAGSYTPEEISKYAARARSQFINLSLQFYDLDIDFPQDGTAKVILTARLTGKTKIGEYVDETHELESVLTKIDDKWLFSDFAVVEVLKK